MRVDLPGQKLLFAEIDIRRRKSRPIRAPKPRGKADPACKDCGGSGLKPIEEIDGIKDKITCDCVKVKRPSPKRKKAAQDPLERVKAANDMLSACWGEATIALGDRLSSQFHGLHAGIAKHGVIIAAEIRKMKGSKNVGG